MVTNAIDLRGHGQTAGYSSVPKGSTRVDRLGQAGITACRDMLSDTKQLGDIAIAENPGYPLIVFGHRMGSGRPSATIQNNGHDFAGAILCGTIGSPLGEIYPLLGHALELFNSPFIQGVSNPTGCEWQTVDPVEVEKFLSDSLCGKPFSNAMTYSVLKGFLSMWTPENERRVPRAHPILIVCGTEDPISAKTISVQRLISRYMANGVRNISHRFYLGGRHEILNATERAHVHSDIGAWIDHVVDTLPMQQAY